MDQSKNRINYNSVINYFKNPPDFYSSVIKMYKEKIETIVNNNEETDTDEILIDFKTHLEKVSIENEDFFKSNNINIGFMIFSLIQNFASTNRDLIDQLVLCDKKGIKELDYSKLENIPNDHDFELLSEEFMGEDNKPVVMEDSTDVDKLYAIIYGFKDYLDKNNNESSDNTIDWIMLYGIKFNILRNKIVNDLKINSKNFNEDMENMGLDRVTEIYLLNQLKKDLNNKDIYDNIAKNIKYHSVCLITKKNREL